MKPLHGPKNSHPKINKEFFVKGESSVKRFPNVFCFRLVSFKYGALEHSATEPTQLAGSSSFSHTFQAMNVRRIFQLSFYTNYTTPEYSLLEAGTQVNKDTVSWPKLLSRAKYFCLGKQDSLIWNTEQNCVTSFVNEAPSSAYSRANWD